MKDSKLIAAFRTLDTKELKKFEKFITSPYFNEHIGIIELGRYLTSLYPDFQGELITKAQIYKACFPDDGYDDLRLRHLVSDFLKLLEQFFSQQSYEEA